VTDSNTERTRQTLEALLMVDYWRTEAEQQRTRAEAAEAELSAEKQRGNSAWDDGYAKGKARAEAAEQELRDLNITIGNHPATSAWAKSGIRAVEVGMAAEAKLAAIRAHLPALKRLHAWVSSDNMGKWTYLEGGNFYDDVQEMTAIVADALEALEP